MQTLPTDTQKLLDSKHENYADDALRAHTDPLGTRIKKRMPALLVTLSRRFAVPTSRAVS